MGYSKTQIVIADCVCERVHVCEWLSQHNHGGSEISGSCSVTGASIQCVWLYMQWIPSSSSSTSSALESFSPSPLPPPSLLCLSVPITRFQSTAGRSMRMLHREGGSKEKMQDQAKKKQNPRHQVCAQSAGALLTANKHSSTLYPCYSRLLFTEPFLSRSLPCDFHKVQNVTPARGGCGASVWISWRTSLWLLSSLLLFHLTPTLGHNGFFSVVYVAQAAELTAAVRLAHTKVPLQDLYGLWIICSCSLFIYYQRTNCVVAERTIMYLKISDTITFFIFWLSSFAAYTTTIILCALVSRDSSRDPPVVHLPLL